MAPISFTLSTSGPQVNNLGPNSLTLELTYAAAAVAATATLELLDTDGTTVLATGMDVSDNFDLGILDFVVPADGTYTVRVTFGSSGRIRYRGDRSAGVRHRTEPAHQLAAALAGRI